MGGSFSGPPDVVIVGGGVVGLSIAWELAGEGMRVTLLERGPLGRESSWAGAGILTLGPAPRAESPIERLRSLSVELIPQWSERLREETGIDNGWRPCGALAVAADPAEAAALAAKALVWRRDGVEVEEISPADLAHLEPAVTSGLAAAFHLPGESQIRNPRHLRALGAACHARGVTLRTGQPAVGFRVEGDRVLELATPAGPIAAAHFVVAAGAWSPALLAQAGVPLPGKPVRGQLVLLDAGIPRVRRTIWNGSRYLVSRPDGRILIGSTEEDAGFDTRPTAGGIEGLLAFSRRLVPELAGVPLERTWAGLRPGSPDGLPAIGRTPGLANLFVATGHFRAGFELSAGTARVVAELLAGRPPSVPLEAFRPERHLALGAAPG